MNAGEGKSINKALKRKTATLEGPKQGLKSVDFARLFFGLSHSKTVGRGFKSYCPCQEKSHSRMLCPVLYGQHKKAPYGSKY